MSVIKDLRLLLWKNYILQIRHPIVTIAELLIPCLFVAMLAGIRRKVDFTNHTNATVFDSFNFQTIPNVNFGTQFRIPYWIVMYSPNDSQINDIMAKVGHKLYIQDHLTEIQLQAFTDEEQMIKYYDKQEAYYQNLILCGIAFENVVQLDNQLKYKIRFPNTPKHNVQDRMRPIKNWWTQFTFPLFSKPGPRTAEYIEGGIPGYYEEGFLAIQHSIAMTVASHITNTTDDIDQDFTFLMQRFPYPPYIEDIFLLALQFLFPIILMLSFIYPAVNLTKNLVIEKEKRLKESMKMMGLKNWLHWTAWAIKSFFWLALSSALLSILLTINIKEGVGILNNSNGFLIYLFFISYSISCISFSFLLSTFFSKANVSAVGAGVLFFLAFMPYFAYFPRYRDLSYTQKLLSCLSCNSALAMGSMLIAMWEGQSEGIQWSNLALTASPDDTLTIRTVFVMLFVDTILYIGLTLYIESVFPGEYGIPQKWYYPLSNSYWFGHKAKVNEEKVHLNGEGNDNFHQTKDDSHNEYIERDPKGLMCGIRVMNLSKKFGDKYAVNNLSVNAYKGQITALLGHNGAGKTTTMSIITGLFPPSEGTAIVNGYDIRKDIDKVRSSLGICPQFDVLFDEMTVEEHLKFFCQLKEFNEKEFKDEINDIIKLLGLEDKAKKEAKTLSGGQKRKLSIGIALVGKSEIVILDEPTSGMDVYARRFTWDLLLAEKLNRTILLSTHFMEEADILSERIAIMSNGQLQCCGSPLFLKKKYGVGYNMTIVKTSDSTDVKPITNLIQFHVNDAKLQTSAGTEVSYSLPHENSHKFEVLFTEIENRRQKLGIDSYGVSITTMEEVFLKVGEYAEEGIKALNANQNPDLNENDVSINMDIKEEERNTGLTLIKQQFLGLLMKKVLYTLRNPSLTLSQILIPMSFAVLVLAMLKNLPKLGDSPSLVLNLDHFKGTEVPYFYKTTENQNILDLVNDYESQFSAPNLVIEQSYNTTDLNKAMVDYILEKSKQSIGYFNLHVPIGAMICDNKNRECLDNTDEDVTIVTALFNNQPFHAIGVSLAAVDLSVVRYSTGNPDYQIEVSNHPLPRTTADKLLQVRYATPQQYQLSENLMFSMSFLAASFAILLVKEKSNKGKHLQQVCGVKLYLFWITSFIWDYVIYLIACLLLMTMYWVFNEEPLATLAQESRLFVVFAVHGFALIPFSYLMSFMFDVPSTAYVRICLFSIIVGIGTFITVVVTELPLLDLKEIGKTLDWIFSIFLTNYNLGRSVYHLYTNYLGNKYCNIAPLQRTCNLGTVSAEEFIHMIKTEFKEFAHLFEQYLSQIPPGTNITIPVPDVIKPCCKQKCNDTCFPWNENFFGTENPGIGRLLLLFVFQCIVFWSLIVLVENNVVRHLNNLWIQFKLYLKKFGKNNTSEKELELIDTIDSDVNHESDRIDGSDLNKLFETDALIIKKLSKYYGDFCAVDHISYGVRKGECFGLLGVNGAGKTTTFKMITGDESISSGDIYVNGFDVKKSIQQVQKQIGYCPQFDGLLEQLTGRETLVLFCRLRGIKEIDIDRHIMDISKLLYFDIHINKLVMNYSGGTKRKLSTAVALLGDPSVSFLDEPTTGVDPVARRCLWDALTKKLSEGRSIVLTSHSMEECEALCNRLIIMVNGKICCIGSPQQLKNKFGKGYTVRIKVTTGLSSTDDYTIGGRRHSKIAWRNDSITSNDIVLEQNIKNLEEFMKSSFEGTELKEIHYNLLNFQINNTTISWSKIFGAIERAKETLNIEDYAVGQTTLEQIFLGFAAKQKVD